MIEAPHWLQTHIRSSLYIYKVFQHLLLRLVVIMMQPQPNTCWVSEWKVAVGDSVGFWLTCIMLSFMIGASQPLHIYSYRIFVLHVKSVSAPVEAHITNRQKIIPQLIIYMVSIRMQISGWGCILMTTCHNIRCWKCLYMYGKDPIWVDMKWVRLTFSTWQERNRENRLLALWLWDQVYIRLGLHPYDHKPLYK
jgi:hypothetical protein